MPKSFSIGNSRIGKFFKKVSKKIVGENITDKDKAEFEKRKESYENKAKKFLEFSQFFKIGADTWKKLEDAHYRGVRMAYKVIIGEGVKKIKKLDCFKQLPMGSANKVEPDYFINTKKHFNVDSIEKLVSELETAGREYEVLSTECGEVAYFYGLMMANGNKTDKKEYAKLKGVGDNKQKEANAHIQRCSDIYADISGKYTNAMCICFREGDKSSEIKLRNKLDAVLNKRSLSVTV